MSKDKLINKKVFTFFFRKKVNSLLKFSSKGFTLIEVLIYSALLAIVSLVILTFVNQMLQVSETSRRLRESTDNARRAVDTISQEVRHAQKFYGPTSVLDDASGQLSLETTRDLPVGESATYVDFYLDNGGLYQKRETDTIPQLLTSDKVRVTKLTFSNPAGASSRPVIRTTITVEYKDSISGPKTPVTMTTTATLRSL